MPIGQTRTDLEESLIIAFGEFVEDRPPGRVGDRLEEVGHTDTIGKY